MKDYKLLKPISKGGFGKVVLAEHIKSGDIFAIKIVNRQNIVLLKLNYLMQK
jgi:serine/threonine protein kinase